MAAAVVAAVCWVLFSVSAVEAADSTKVCQNFKSLKLINPGQSVTHRCPKEECRDGKVIGTDLYDEESDVCLAALHAGVLTNLGANISITRQQSQTTYMGATAENRIVSESKERTLPFPVYQVESVVEVKGVVEEVLMVHNGASDDAICFTCLSQDQVSPISSKNLKSWSYGSMNTVSVKGEDTPQMVCKIYPKQNAHAVRILGSRRDEDVLAVVQYPNAEYQSKVATVRASIGDNITIQLQKKSKDLSNELYFRQLPHGWTSSPISNLSRHLTPAHPSYTGIYIVHQNKGRGHKHGAYFDLVVRECKAGYFGISCSKKCPPCQNGGQCHTRRGTCLCPPGFIGDTCQYACLPGRFGNECQFRCDQKTVGFLGTKEKEEGSCVGLTICLPLPYGCSCAAGFTHPTGFPAPTCTRECPKGYFGADCSQRCLRCFDDECNPFSGTCMQGCQRNKDCRQGPLRPDGTITPRQQGYTATWEASDSGAYYFLSQQLLRQISCTTDKTEGPQEHHYTCDTPTYTASNLFSHASYNVCIVASSREGLSPPWCSTVKTLSKVPDVTITELKCEEEGEELKCYAHLDGGCESYNGPNVTITFILHTWLSCSHHLTTLQSFVELKGTKAEVTFSKYLAGVKYQVTAEVGNIAGTGHNYNTSYLTHPKLNPRYAEPRYTEFRLYRP